MRCRAVVVALAAVAGVAVLVGSVAPAAVAQTAPAPDEPQGPAKVGFADDFPELVDHQWGFPLGGFGGIRRGAPIEKVPVVFVHGNNTDHGDWYPVRDAFREAGWSDQELWALSYNGLGGNSGRALSTENPEAEQERAEMGWDGRTRITSNEVNVPDLHDFITAVQDYTGSRDVVLVGHSLGVTLARRTLKVHQELRDDLVAFVGIAGGNHGTSFCPPGSELLVVGCDELGAGSEWLDDLNGPDGTDETYGRARWLTVYDGSGVADPGFLGPTYAQSPALLGADNREYAGTYHNDLRLDPAIVADYRAFIEETVELHLEELAHAAASGPPSRPAAPAPVDEAPAGPPPLPASEPVRAPSLPSPGAGASVPQAPRTDAAPPDARGAGGTEGSVPATMTIERIGRHWSGAANAALAAVLVAGVALLALDLRRRRPGAAPT